MTKRAGRKHSFYFPDWMSRELEAEAARLERSTSWVLQRAWKLAHAEIARLERSKVPSLAVLPARHSPSPLS